ncbi:unnamed protein product [Dicrocoelium dendriticum]|nr:unnamed protein product [Dicrocoelium dendriticum]
MSLPATSPSRFWTDSAFTPNAECWEDWKISFSAYISVLPVLNPSMTLKTEHTLKPLRLHFGSEGRRIFDALNLRKKPTLTKALSTLDKHWDIRVNTYNSRYHFSQLNQASGESVDAFISRLVCALRKCDYNSIPKKKVEETIALQKWISGLTDSRTRESLLMENEIKLTWDRACDVARANVAVTEQNKIFLANTGATEIDRLNSTRSLTRSSVRNKCYRCGNAEHRANDVLQRVNYAGIALSPVISLGFVVHAPFRQLILQITPELLRSPLNNLYMSLMNANIHFRLQLKNPNCLRQLFVVLFEVRNKTIRLDMELYSVSPTTVVSYCFYKQHFGQLTVHPSAYTFSSYSNGDVRVVGFVTVSMFLINSRKRIVEVYFSKTDSKALLGRNAMVLLSVSPFFSQMIIASVNLHSLLTSYPKHLLPDIGRVSKAMHRIQLSADYKPFSISQARAIHLVKRKAFSQVLKNMIKEDLIEPIQCFKSVHPLAAVQKKNGSSRLCAELRAFNRHILVDKFPLHSLEEVMIRFKTPKFSQNLKGCIVYMDDICVFVSNPTEHQENLRNVLHRLNELNLRLNTNTCQIAVTEVEFIGHVIPTSGIKPNVQNTRAILDCPKPCSITLMKQFLGLCSYYLRHLPNFAIIAEPLRRLTRQNQMFRWATEQDNAYLTIRVMIECTSTVAIFNEHCPTFVSTDASDVGLGEVLSQLHDGEEKVIEYASRTLSDTERNYSTGEKEALACLRACGKWQFYLLGYRFTLHTDRSALKTLLIRGNKSQKPVRLIRWYSYLLNYDYEIKFDGQPYRQDDVVAMEGPLGPLLADIFMAMVGSDCEPDLRQMCLYKRHVDDSLVIAPALEAARSLLKVTNATHPNARFTEKLRMITACLF